MPFFACYKISSINLLFFIFQFPLRSRRLSHGGPIITNSIPILYQTIIQSPFSPKLLPTPDFSFFSYSQPYSYCILLTRIAFITHPDSFSLPFLPFSIATLKVSILPSSFLSYCLFFRIYFGLFRFLDFFVFDYCFWNPSLYYAPCSRVLLFTLLLVVVIFFLMFYSTLGVFSLNFLRGFKCCYEIPSLLICPR